jgi:zinc protease
VARWLANGHVTLEVVPFAQVAAAATGADRTAVPPAGAPPAPRFPDFVRTELGNGLDVILVENHSLPRVEMQLLVDAGFAADQAAGPGTASLTLDMLDEGAAGLGSLEIAERLDTLGATLQPASNLDVSTISLSALKETLDGTLDLFADVVLRPDFPQAELDRLKAQRLAAIAREKSDPSNAGLRVLPRLLYGEGHAYSNPLSGLGTEEAVKALKREDLAAFHHAWFRPNASTLIVVGDVTMDEMRPKLQRLFGGWERGSVPQKNLAAVAPASRSRAYLIDRPGSVQSVIFAGHAAPPKSAPDDLALEAMNRVFGGTFTSRLNMNLREDKAWSYGTRSSMSGTRGPRPFYVAAPVQSDKTKESAAEIRRELEELLGRRPITATELQKAKDVATLTLPGRWETMSAVATSIADIVRFGLPDTYWDDYPASVRSLDAAALQAAAVAHLHPDGLTWLVVGDRAKVEPGLRELFGDLTVLDADGRPVGSGPGVGQ